MIIISHDEKTYTEVDLPVDLNQLLPPGMGEQMMEMLKFEVTVTPSEEVKKVGSWDAKRYDLKLSSAMMNMESVLWATKDAPIDFAAYHDLYSNIMSLQPGMDAMMSEMKKIEGYVVAQDAVLTMKMMGETSMGTTDEVVSIEEMAAPAGTYAPPGDYSRKDFNYMEMMQNQ
jgi:hypothetical protein